MTLALPAAKAEEVYSPHRTRAAAVPWLVTAAYLAAALALTSRLWVDPASRAQIGDPADVDQFAWFLRYSATALAHARLPAVTTTSMNAPHGISLLWNTSLLLPGVLLAPVTWAAGPQVSLTIMLTAGFAGSAASLFWVLRRWHAPAGVAALGGAFYGFSPAVVNSGIGHYNLQFAVLPPLIIDALLRVLTGRGQPVRTGAWLGLLTAAQMFLSEELGADTALAGLVITAALVASNPRAVRDRAAATAYGLAAAMTVALVTCGNALWTQLRGPLAQHGSAWPTGVFTSHPADFVTAPGTVLLHTAASAAAARHHQSGLSEYLAYLGWPMLITLLVAALWCWRDARARVAAVTFGVLELGTLGGRTLNLHGLRYPGVLLPWHWLQGLPLIGEALPDRLSILADGAGAALLAFAAQRVFASAPLRDGSRALACALAGAAVLPLVPLPYHVARVPPVPAGWRVVLASLRVAPAAPVLTVPVPSPGRAEPLRWQAETGEPATLIGGYFLGPDAAGQATLAPGVLHQPVIRYLDWLWDGRRRVRPPSAAAVHAALKRWRPAAIIAATPPGSRLGRYLACVLGPPSLRDGSLLAWRGFPSRSPGLARCAA